MKQKCFASFPTAHGSVANGRAYGQNDVQAFSGDLTRPEQHQEICSVDTTRPCGFVEQPPARHAQNPQLGSFSENRVSGFGPVVSLAFTLERKNVPTAKARSTTGVKVDFHRRKDLKKKKKEKSSPFGAKPVWGLPTGPGERCCRCRCCCCSQQNQRAVLGRGRSTLHSRPDEPEIASLPDEEPPWAGLVLVKEERPAVGASHHSAQTPPPALISRRNRLNGTKKKTKVHQFASAFRQALTLKR